MAVLQNIINGFQNIGERPAPYSETSVEIKNKILPRHSRTGVLSEFHINDILTAKKDVSNFYRQHGRHYENIAIKLHQLQPRVAPMVDDDPFI